MKSLYEQLGGTYHEGKDELLYPDLPPPPEDEPRYGKYGRMRRTYLKEHHEGLYTGLLLSGKLNAHLRHRPPADGADHQADGQGPGRHRGAEGQGSNGLSRSDGEYPQCSGRDCPWATNLLNATGHTTR